MVPSSKNRQISIEVAVAFKSANPVKGGRVLAVGGADPKRLAPSRMNAMAAHKAGDPATTRFPALLAQGGMDSWYAVAVPMLCVKSPDSVEQAFVFTRPSTLGPGSPRIISGWRYIQSPTKNPDRIFLTTVFNNPEHHLG